MVTDPVRTVKAAEHEVPLARRLPATLRRLAELPPSVDPPYLTVALDWRPQGERPGREGRIEPEAAQRRGGHEKERPGPVWRASWEQVGRQLDDLLAKHEPHTPTHQSLSAALARIPEALQEVDPAAHGVYIVANEATEVFEVLAVGLPLETTFTLGPTPTLNVLARMMDDHPPYAILLSDQREATLTFVSQGVALSELNLVGGGYPQRTDQGGWSQQRYQRRADERIESFAQHVGEQTRVALEESGIQRLVVAADEPVASVLQHELHATVSDRIVGTTQIQGGAPIADQIAASVPLVEQYEREREAQAVQQIEDNHGPGGTAVAGGDDVVAALLSGQVMTLVINSDFTAPGWADFDQGLVGAGEVPSEHPYGGDEAALVSVELEQELVRLALQQDATIEIVAADVPVSTEELTDIPEAGQARPRSDAATQLDALGGVGALLRYSLSGDQSTAEL